ncbi:MAG TPA: sugar ABC transporter permease [Acidimicrobiales bacterium]|nr:sugar ABC transporter permease [Acidimicrobiales bacterium]
MAVDAITKAPPGRRVAGTMLRPPRRVRRVGARRELVAAGFFLLPFIALLALFQYFAIGLMIRNSFYTYSLLNPAEGKFSGLTNYRVMIHDPVAIQSIEVTLLFALGIVATQVPLGLALAIFLNIRRRGVQLLRSVVFLPVVTSVVVVTTMWTFIYAPSDGLANSLLHFVHLPSLLWATSDHEALPAMILMTLWEEVGFSMMLFLAGLQSIPVEFEEAAAVDGANPWQRFWRVTLPLLNRTTVLVVVVSTIFAIQAFAQAYIMTQGGPDYSTQFLVYNIYTEAFDLGDPGYASAISVVMLVIVLIITTAQMRALRGRLQE